MKLVSSIPNVIKGDWSSVVNFADAVQKNINKLAGMKLGPSSSPSFDSITIDGLAASRLTSTDSIKKLVSTNLYSWIAGTANRITIADDGDGTVTLSAPQDLHIGATPTFAGATLTGPLNISDSHVTNLGYIDWDLTSDGTVAEGRMFWNADDGTLNLGMPGGNVNLQIGQEELHRVCNDEVSTITNGSVVYISGSTGDVANVKLADASSYTTAYVLGVATEDIASHGFGYVTTSGLVRDINTTGLSYGVPLWLGATPGTFTQSIPEAPNMAVFIGYVVRAHGTDGIITVKPTVVPRFSMLSDVYGTADTTGQFSVWDQTNGYFTLTHNISEFQPVDTELSAIAALTPTDSNIIVGDGSTWVAESGDTARTSLGLGTGDSPSFAGLTIGSGAISGTLIGQWNTAYGWGDHAGLYDPVGTAAGEVGTHESTYDHSLLHSPITLGTANGLSLTGQELSLPTTATPQFARLGVGAAAHANVPLHINPPANSYNQVLVQCNSTGGFALLAYGPDNNCISFDARWANGWIAEDTSSAWLYKIGDKLRIQGSAGNTVGAATVQNTYLNVNLSDGYVAVGRGTAAAVEMLEVAGKIRANTAFNLNGTDGVTQASSAGKVCDVTALAGGIATAQTQITYATNGTYNFDATAGKVSSITIVNGRITAITTA